MLDPKGKQQRAYTVIDKKTGKKYATYESYAKKLEKSGKMKIVAKEGESKFSLIQEGKGR